MCGILAILRARGDAANLRQRALELSKRLRHRGPDWSGLTLQTYDPALPPAPASSGPAAATATTIAHDAKRAKTAPAPSSTAKVSVLAHERLAIVDPAGGAQPLHSADGHRALTVNGEIFNHVALRRQLDAEAGEALPYATHSDCEVILHLYERKSHAELCNLLDGYFAFVISDARDGSFLVARDPIGVNPLYIGFGRDDGSIWVASEMKALCDECHSFQEFPPGHWFDSETMRFHRYYEPAWFDEHIPSAPLDLGQIRTLLERAVVKRLMCDVPYGVLLSGGLDSSLVASIASRHAARRVEDGERTAAWWPRLHSFSVGLRESPDLKAARRVADFLGTVHHEIVFTVQDGLDAIADVIGHLETYDVTTIRAATPMYLLSRVIKALGVKMVLSGEGSDEAFGGYLYFHRAPSKEALHVETCTKLKMLSKYDCLRANKATMAWGVEARVPFLDKEFLAYVMNIDPVHKLIDAAAGRIEKYILRKAFDTPEAPYLPQDVLWRQKEQFSDGVGYSWIDSLKARAETLVSDDMLRTAEYRFPINPPVTKEALWYRQVFAQHFPQEAAAKTVPGGPSVACSSATAALWDKAWLARGADPSGRAVLGVHQPTSA